MKTFFLALTFLSIIPIPSSFWTGETRIEKAIIWFPVVGGILGAVSFLFFLFLSDFIPERPSFILSFLFYHLLNGGLHLDGLADFSDAFFGAKKNEVRFKDILKDSRIGAMGVIALLFYFLAFYSLSESVKPSLSFFVALGMSGRASIVIFATNSKPLFSDGLGRLFIEKTSRFEFYPGIFLYLFQMLLLGSKYLTIAFLVILFSFIFKYYILRKFGGFSGDIFGAGCSLAEILTTLFVVAIK